jgi:hypothetical protein
VDEEVPFRIACAPAWKRKSGADGPSGMQRALIVIGLVIAAAGLAWPWLSKLGLGRLPGDIRVETEGGGFYFPIVTCLVISIVLSVVLWLFRR